MRGLRVRHYITDIGGQRVGGEDVLLLPGPPQPLPHHVVLASG